MAYAYKTCHVMQCYLMLSIDSLISSFYFTLQIMRYLTFCKVFLRAASCKKSIRKNKSTRKHILKLNMCFLVDLFFLLSYFFLLTFYMKRPLNLKTLQKVRLSNFLTTSQNIRIAADQATYVSSQQQNLYFRMPR